jgi:uncharacterized membrane protein
MSDSIVEFDPSVSQLQGWAALGIGAGLLVLSARRRPIARLCLAAAAAPLVYRGISGQWPTLIRPSDDTKVALAGSRGVHVRDSIRLERPIAEVFSFWRRLDNLPRFMAHLEAVHDHGNGRSHWVARGPGGLRVAWDAETINELENQLIAWRSLPGSEIVTAGSVQFDRVRAGRSTQLTVTLQYEPPAGHAGDFVARLFGRSASQMIREDLRRLKQVLEAGAVIHATAEAAAEEVSV